MESSKTEAIKQDQGIFQSLQVLYPKQAVGKPNPSGPRSPCLEEAEGTAGPWEAKAADRHADKFPRVARAALSRDPAAGPLSGLPHGPDHGESPAETRASMGMGCLSPGAALEGEAAWPRGSRAPALPARRLSNSQASGGRPLLSPGPEGKANFPLWDSRSCQEPPLELYKENITVAFLSHLLPQTPYSCLPYFLLQRLPEPLFPPSPPETRAPEREAVGPNNRAGLTAPKGQSPSAAGGRGSPDPASPAFSPPPPRRGDPGARGNASLGQPSSPSSPTYKLVPGASASGDFHSPSWRLGETPESPRANRLHRQDARLPATPLPNAAGRRRAPGLSAAGAPPIPHRLVHQP